VTNYQRDAVTRLTPFERWVFGLSVVAGIVLMAAFVWGIGTAYTPPSNAEVQESWQYG
jgi:hypothetical protein